MIGVSVEILRGTGNLQFYLVLSHSRFLPSITYVYSEVGSIQLEFKYLSHYLDNPVYAEKADKVYHVLAQTVKNDKREGLYPVYINPENGGFTSGKSSVISR